MNRKMFKSLICTALTLMMLFSLFTLQVYAGDKNVYNPITDPANKAAVASAPDACREFAYRDGEQTFKGEKLSSNAHFAALAPYIYLYWDSGQAVGATVYASEDFFYKYASFDIFLKSADIKDGRTITITDPGFYRINAFKDKKGADAYFKINWAEIGNFVELPELDIAVEGECRVNRKIVVYGTTVEGPRNYGRVIANGTVSISIVALDDSVFPIPNALIDEETECDDYKEFIVKQAGCYEIELTLVKPEKTKIICKTITVADDLAPIADFGVDGLFYRGPDGIALISATDLSYSPDGDALATRQWEIVHDVNNDGSFTGAVQTLESGGDIEFAVGDVGVYRISLAVTEDYENTIQKYLTDGDFLSDRCVNEFEVGNQAPSVSGGFSKAMRLDIVAAFGEIDENRKNSFKDALIEAQEVFFGKGVQFRLGGVESHTYSASDAFSWEVYDHPNYTTMSGSFYTQGNPVTTPNPRPSSIMITNDGADIRMEGYNREAYKDFLYLPDNDPGEKVFTFDLLSSANSYHSMEGGGFLFNTRISGNTIDGYSILVTSSGLRLSRINNLNLTNFRAGTANSTVLFNRAISSPTGRHSFKIVTTPSQISVWDNGVLVIDGYNLPAIKEYFGFGPITSHISHSCGQISYFTFTNLRMESNQNFKLSDTLVSYDWNVGDSSILVHISDGEITEFEEKGAMGRAMEAILSKELFYVGAGSGDAAGQIAAMAENAGGIVLDGEDVGAFASELADFLYGYALADAASNPGIFTVDDRILYTHEFTDPENDPQADVVFKYIHDPDVFPINDGAIGDSGVYGASKPELKKAGAYSVYIKVSDSPSPNAALNAAYSKSAEELLGEILVVNRPVASLKVTVNGGTLVYEADGYAPNRKNETNAGIENEEWKWKDISSGAWTPGKPSDIPNGGEYLIYYRVQDAYGIWSIPAVAYIR